MCSQSKFGWSWHLAKFEKRDRDLATILIPYNLNCFVREDAWVRYIFGDMLCVQNSNIGQFMHIVPFCSGCTNLSQRIMWLPKHPRTLIIDICHTHTRRVEPKAFPIPIPPQAKKKSFYLSGKKRELTLRAPPKKSRESREGGIKVQVHKKSRSASQKWLCKE